MVQFLGHFCGDQIGLNGDQFFTVGETRMADGEYPEKDPDQGENDGQDKEASDAVEDGIEDEPAPLLAGQEIHGWDEYYCKIYHIVLGFVGFCCGAAPAPPDDGLACR